ncbi:hypothetical protein EYZ11_012345 [Aspergillus tanneri]|uniref:4a-hydroxytetrahydrobiopterin dehydratase n=1 Tax=Aspergillus tanneri TaxID=1220188 RepID=A0A4S3J0G3_9EURO|nr:hypothetical protein EYZ11_012345 [Aspergillus tanneri]
MLLPDFEIISGDESGKLTSRIILLLASSLPTCFLRTPPSKRTLITPNLNPRNILSRGLSTVASEPQFAEGIDAGQLQYKVDALIEQGWKLDEDGMGVQKTFYFRSYFKAVAFVNVVASQSASQKHHPTMTVVRDTLTHDACSEIDVY